jgi:hypothetical protein
LAVIFGYPLKCEDKLKQKQTTTLLSVAVFLIATLAFIQPAEPSTTQPQIDHWTAHPMYLSPYAGSSTPIGYTPEQIRKAYNLPASGGEGTTIAIIDAYDTPNILNYFNTFSAQYNLPNNSTGKFLVHKMAQHMSTDSNWAMETCLDVEWAHAIAPNATILLVEATAPTDTALLAAIDYATSQPDVVAVSMSWGGREFSWEGVYESHFNKAGITFFASSGDDGSYVNWPAVSANVVSVGGTNLTFSPDGTVNSEVAWRNSSGGMSNYIAAPSFQTSYGLIYSNRTVPDVAYYAYVGNDAYPNGVSVYNDGWWKVGGTSAGAPQWAAIHALGLSTTNTNLYARAKSAYSSYFRDITDGSNYVNSADSGYDLVTGLGSPLTTNFGTYITVSPSSGTGGGPTTISGLGFTGSYVNISYINPISGSRIFLPENVTLSSGAFTLPIANVPDLLQNNPAGDNTPLSDNIIFSAADYSSSKLYNATYTEYRRGIYQLGSATAQGLYGNNTDLTSTLFVQSGNVLPIAGRWFIPGSATLFWDDTVAGTATIDVLGTFTTTLTVPATTTGQHTVTISNGEATFRVNLTCVPSTLNDYVDSWHTSDFTVNLTPDSPVNETFYRINGGDVQNVTSNGQPTITTEGDNNTLEYWSNWNTSPSAAIELPHVMISGIKLDKTPPTGTISTNPTTATVGIPLTLSASDALSGPAQMRFSNDGGKWSNWETYATSKAWTLQGGDGVKTVYVQYSDNAGLESAPYSCTVTLMAPQPMSSPLSMVAPTASPTVTPTEQPSATVEPSPTPAVPEFNLPIIMVLFAVLTLLAASIFKRRKLRL